MSSVLLNVDIPTEAAKSGFEKVDRLRKICLADISSTAPGNRWAAGKTVRSPRYARPISAERLSSGASHNQSLYK